uniref:Dirigent protein n=1 Tax=Oryza sativa subsp. japonica TaxID=39947 RepID=Q6H603_ORYSJ|nr:disease resistance response protein-like [Oryza sativa Japonica Group]
MANCRKRTAHDVPACAVAEAEQQPIHLHFYMHDVVTGPGATAAEVVNGTGARRRWRGSGRGRAQGLYVFATLDADAPALLFSINNVVLAAGTPYGGSMVAVMGRDDFVRLPVVSGTGRFRMARGYALVRTASEHGKNAVLEIDICLTSF